MNGTSEFIIEKHKTQYNHFDLLLHGRSRGFWIVPNGIPLLDGEQKLAIEDENGRQNSVSKTMREDCYGLGKVLLWDSGTYELKYEKPDKLIFLASGEKFRGRFILLVPSWGRWTKKKLWVLTKIPYPNAEIECE